MKAVGVGNDKRARAGGDAFGGRQLHLLKVFRPGAERAFFRITVMQHTRVAGAPVFPFETFRRQPVSTAHIGEGSHLRRHILKEQPCLHCGMKRVCMHCFLRIRPAFEPAIPDALDIKQGWGRLGTGV